MRKGICLQTLLMLFFSAGLIDQPFAGTKGLCAEAEFQIEVLGVGKENG